jgi:WD40 repeat protein
MNVREEIDLSTPGAAVALAWSRDGSALAAASNYGSTLTIWDKAGHLINRFARTGGGAALGNSLAFIEGSSQLVFPPPAEADHDVAVAVWDVATGKIMRTIKGPQPNGDHAANVAQQLSAYPNEKLLAVATRGGKNQNNLIVYDTQSWVARHTDQISSGVSSLCIFADGRLLGLGLSSTGRIEILDAVSGTISNEFPAYGVSKYGTFALTAVAGSPAGDLIMTGVGLVVTGGEFRSSAEQLSWAKSMSSTDAVRMFRVKDGKLIASFTGATAPIRQAMWDPRGRYVAFVDSAHNLFLWAPWKGDMFKKVDLRSPTLSVAVSPDGDQIAVSTDQGVRIFSIN